MKTFQQFLLEVSKQERTTMKDFEKMVHIFLPFVLRELKIKALPPLHFESKRGGFHVKDIPGITSIEDSKFSEKKQTFGQTSKKNRIVINIENRHPLDALRTLAHEIAHYRQHIIGIHGTGETGSSTENQANVIAGIIMRNFDQKHPEYFNYPPIESHS